MSHASIYCKSIQRFFPHCIKLFFILPRWKFQQFRKDFLNKFFFCANLRFIFLNLNMFSGIYFKLNLHNIFFIKCTLNWNHIDQTLFSLFFWIKLIQSSFENNYLIYLSIQFNFYFLLWIFLLFLPLFKPIFLCHRRISF